MSADLNTSSDSGTGRSSRASGDRSPASDCESGRSSRTSRNRITLPGVAPPAPGSIPPPDCLPRQSELREVAATRGPSTIGEGAVPADSAVEDDARSRRAGAYPRATASLGWLDTLAQLALGRWTRGKATQSLARSTVVLVVVAAGLLGCAVALIVVLVQARQQPVSGAGEAPGQSQSASGSALDPSNQLPKAQARSKAIQTTPVVEPRERSTPLPATQPKRRSRAANKASHEAPSEPPPSVASEPARSPDIAARSF